MWGCPSPQAIAAVHVQRKAVTNDSPFQLNGRLINNEMQLQLRNDSRRDVEGAAIEFEFPQLTAGSRRFHLPAISNVCLSGYIQGRSSRFAPGSPVFMKCREGCGACCIAPSISSAIPGMPMASRPASAACTCPSTTLRLFGKPERPAVCGGFKADVDVCGSDRDEAIRIIGWLEQMTAA
jgi:hypothetical protein